MKSIYQDIIRNGENRIYYSDDHITICIPYIVEEHKSIFKNSRNRAIEMFWKSYYELTEKKYL